MQIAQNQILEVAIFRAKEELPAEVLHQKLQGVSMFLSAQPGFVQWMHAFDQAGNRLDFVVWNSMNEAKAASEKAMQSEECQPYFEWVDQANMQFFHFQPVAQFEIAGR